MNEKTVELQISGGIVDAIKIPSGVKVIVRDYDIDAGAEEEKNKEYLRLDENKAPYLYLEFNETKEP